MVQFFSLVFPWKAIFIIKTINVLILNVLAFSLNLFTTYSSFRLYLFFNYAFHVVVVFLQRVISLFLLLNPLRDGNCGTTFAFVGLF